MITLNLLLPSFLLPSPPLRLPQWLKPPFCYLIHLPLVHSPRYNPIPPTQPIKIITKATLLHSQPYRCHLQKTRLQQHQPSHQHIPFLSSPSSSSRLSWSSLLDLIGRRWTRRCLLLLPVLALLAVELGLEPRLGQGLEVENSALSGEWSCHYLH